MKLASRLLITILLLSSLGLMSAVAASVVGVAQIDLPANDAVLSGQVEVRGTALLANSTPDDFRYYRVEYNRMDEVNRTFTTTSSTVRDMPVQDGLLDTWDTTLVPNGTYTIHIQVYGLRGLTKEASISVIVSNDLPPLQPVGQQAAFVVTDH